MGESRFNCAHWENTMNFAPLNKYVILSCSEKLVLITTFKCKSMKFGFQRGFQKGLKGFYGQKNSIPAISYFEVMYGIINILLKIEAFYKKININIFSLIKHLMHKYGWYYVTNSIRTIQSLMKLAHLVSKRRGKVSELDYYTARFLGRP